MRKLVVFGRWHHHDDDLSGRVDRLEERTERLETQMSSAQQDIDTDTAAISSVVNTGLPAIQAEIAALKAQGVNTAALDAAVASLASGVAAIVPPPAPPAPATPPVP